MRDTRDYDSQFYREELARDTATMLTTVDPAEKSQLYRRISSARDHLRDAERREEDEGLNTFESQCADCGQHGATKHLDNEDAVDFGFAETLLCSECYSNHAEDV